MEGAADNPALVSRRRAGEDNKLIVAARRRERVTYNTTLVSRIMNGVTYNLKGMTIIWPWYLGE